MRDDMRDELKEAFGDVDEMWYQLIMELHIDELANMDLDELIEVQDAMNKYFGKVLRASNLLMKLVKIEKGLF